MSSADPPAGRAPGSLDLDEPFDVDGLHALRSTLAAHASRLGLGDRHIETLIIVASELATNAIRHGGGSGRIRLWHNRDELYCQVSDDGPGLADPTAGATPPDPRRDGGRGLWIIRNLATELVIERGPAGRGTAITVTIHAPAD